MTGTGRERPGLNLVSESGLCPDPRNVPGLDVTLRKQNHLA